MRNVDVRDIKIEPHHIVVAVTSEPDYEMSRSILLALDSGRYVVIEGSHCSCYGFDETQWFATEYSYDEIRKLIDADYNREDYFWDQVRLHV